MTEQNEKLNDAKDISEEAKKEKKATVKRKKEVTAEAKEEAKAEIKEAPKDSGKSRKRKKKNQSQAVIARGKRKESIARATILPGKGRIKINHMNLDSYYSNKYVKEIVMQPLNYAGPVTANIDISVNVYGGGVMGQAQAARTAIANALVDYFKDDKLKEKFLDIDRSLLVEDVRRVEPKKFKGPKARARFQKSYR